MSDGSSVLIRAAFKPTPSIAQMRTALGSDGQVHGLEITGRHDPVIVPRAVVVVECMTAITVLDLMMRNMTARMDSLKKIYAPAKQ
jgi:chorismate synthase